MWGKTCERVLVGLRLLERGIARQGYYLFSKNDEPIGEVTSGSISPLTRESIALGWVKRDYATLGEEICVEIRGQKLTATIVKPPFYKS
jgi:aminomethyltransferase